MNATRNAQLISFLTLRKSIGFIAIGMPFFLIIGSILVGSCESVQPSISAYYHTIMRDGFVGIICAISFFMFCYTGYDKGDFYLTRIAACAALLVAFFPTSIEDTTINSCLIPRILENKLINYVHFISAAIFFLALAFMSIFQFTKSAYTPDNFTKDKKIRNSCYRVSGYVMLACLVLLSLYFLVLKNKFPALEKFNIVFILESIALAAFGVSWLTKGQIFSNTTEI
jgi:hypothetical protein